MAEVLALLAVRCRRQRHHFGFMEINRQIKMSGPSAAMTRESAVASQECEDDFDDADFYKDVYEPTGAAYRLLQIETAFTRAGYDIRKSELSPHRAPIIILYLRRATAPEFGTDARFAEHVCKLLAEVGVRLRKRDVAIQQTGNRILLAFPLEQPAGPKRKKRITLRNLLAQLP
jgi:hypothetical protein